MTSPENVLLNWESEGTDTCTSSDKSSTVPSETSTDRDFIASDSESLSYASHNSSDALYLFRGHASEEEYGVQVSASRYILNHIANIVNIMTGQKNSNQNNRTTISDAEWPTCHQVSCSVVLVGR
jgi:hypothetical protein